MQNSFPILIGDQNEDFRSLLREMLGKSGFFHVLEASSTEELSALLQSNPDSALTITQLPLLDAEIERLLLRRGRFIILSRSETSESVLKAAILGVEHFLSFPFSSQRLLQKIEKIISP